MDPFKYKHTPEDAEGLAADLIPSNILTDLGDANWKTRLAALEEMTTWIESVVEEVDAEVIVRALAKKGWAEKNFQVGRHKTWDLIYQMLTVTMVGVFQALWHIKHSGRALPLVRAFLRSAFRGPS